MRERMLNSGPFHAAFFIGGMEGVESEFSMFRTKWPTTPVYPVASTGAAASILLENWNQNFPSTFSSQLAQDLRRDFVYGELFDRLLTLR